jgi:hypothetical protein
MDRVRIGMNFHGWVAASRDPFQLNRSATPIKASKLKNSDALAKLKLQSIWIQTGRSEVVINGLHYNEGDTIEGYRIVSIEPDTVWFETANSREHLDFPRRPPVPMIQPLKSPETNAPPPLSAEKEDASGAKSQ